VARVVEPERALVAGERVDEAHHVARRDGHVAQEPAAAPHELGRQRGQLGLVERALDGDVGGEPLGEVHRGEQLAPQGRAHGGELGARALTLDVERLSVLEQREAVAHHEAHHQHQRRGEQREAPKLRGALAEHAVPPFEGEGRGGAHLGKVR
jgi:hypothetical protein